MGSKQGTVKASGARAIGLYLWTLTTFGEIKGFSTKPTKGQLFAEGSAATRTWAPQTVTPSWTIILEVRYDCGVS